jgi:hypothetical protein
MDNVSFTLISAAAAVGGALGTFVGFKKLGDTRRNEQELLENKIGSIANSNVKTVITTNNRMSEMNHVLNYAHDFARTVGYLGLHSLYGMVVYPWVPLYLLGSHLRQDSRRHVQKVD